MLKHKLIPEMKVTTNRVKIDKVDELKEKKEYTNQIMNDMTSGGKF